MTIALRRVTFAVFVSLSFFLTMSYSNAGVSASFSEQPPPDDQQVQEFPEQPPPISNQTTTTTTPISNQTTTTVPDDQQLQQFAEPQSSDDNISAGNDPVLENVTEIQEALWSYDTALQVDPNNINALDGKGALLFHLGSEVEAMVYFDRALQVDPNNIIALDGKGAALDSLGEHQDALEYYDGALQVDPNNGDVLNNKGGALGNLERYEEAMQYTDRALQVDPNNGDVLNNKGSALFHLGRYDEAMVYFYRALQVDPNNVDASTNMGTILAILGRYDEAIVYFDRILSYIDPNYVPALVNLGIALENLGRYQEAVQYFERASLISGSDVGATPASNSKKDHFELIASMWKEDHLLKNMVLTYNSIFNWGDSQLNDVNTYKERYQLLYISHQDQVDVDKETSIGIAKFKIHDYPGAMAVFDEILGLNAMHPNELVKQLQLVVSLYYKGLCLENLGDGTTAQKYKNEAIAVDPSYNGDIPPLAKFAAPVQLILGVPPSL